MFKQSTKDVINGWGSVFRFVTPILITITLFTLNALREDIKTTKQTLRIDITQARTERKENDYKIDKLFTNHLEHHRLLEIALCERLGRIETILTLKRDKR